MIPFSRFGLRPRPAPLLLLALALAGPLAGQNHDLVLEPAPDATSADPAVGHSPDIKVGADFGDASVPDIIRRGVTNPLFARFYVNGVQDFNVPSDPAARDLERTQARFSAHPAVEHCRRDRSRAKPHPGMGRRVCHRYP